ncbi:hypothetical protein [Paraburkholderia hospita]|uniref:hypothetical protein n=1 Tax=Paraburkholderia hospita TaxID=169430 RepID=UPI0009A5984F|nr:hypothetical protein [Paraburkholderia hospita]SKC69790.1 hypothetical protein SAMN05446934_2012 [Paraburkholderia hospita]
MYSTLNVSTLSRDAERAQALGDSLDEIRPFARPAAVHPAPALVCAPGQQDLMCNARAAYLPTVLAAEQHGRPPSTSDRDGQPEPEPGRAILLDCPGSSNRLQLLAGMLRVLNCHWLSAVISGLILGCNGERLTWWLDKLTHSVESGHVTARWLWFGIDAENIDAQAFNFQNASQIRALVAGGANFICTVDLTSADGTELGFILRSLGVTLETLAVDKFDEWPAGFQDIVATEASAKAFPVMATSVLSSYLIPARTTRAAASQSSADTSSDTELTLAEWQERTELGEAYCNEFAMSRLYSERYRRR